MAASPQLLIHWWCAAVLVALQLGTGCVQAFPSFRERIPNGRRVPCPQGVGGCDVGEAIDCQPALVCNGVGHAACFGGAMPLNAFGLALQAAGYQWTKDLCEADSDGDGLTNGQELGDPCCLWEANDVPSQYTVNFSPTHPGFADAAEYVSSYKAPADCASAAPKTKGITLGEFNPGEDEHMLDLKIDGFQLSSQRTTYVDIAFNLPEAIFNESSILTMVRGDAIVDQKKNLHHYVILGCSKRFPDTLHGKTISRQMAQSPDCRARFGGWAPGARIFNLPSWAGFPFGPGAGIVALVMNVHYDNPDQESGIVDRSGVRLWFTSATRDYTLSSISTSQLSVNPSVKLPAGTQRWFVTRRCELTVKSRKTQAPTEMHVLSVSYHAHLLGREMYTEILRSGTADPVPLSLGSERKWHFDDQVARNVYTAGVVLRTGDVLQTTCIMDTRGQRGITVMGSETTDEMCWQSFQGWSTDGASIAGSCAGNVWTGTLEDEEAAYGIAQRHPSETALNVWDGTNLRSGGAQVVADGMTVTCRDTNQMCTRISASLGGGQVTCDGDLGKLNPRLNGIRFLDACCATACFGTDMCSDHRKCQEEQNKSVAARQQRSYQLPVSATYRVEAPACGNDEGFQTLDLITFPVSTTSASSGASATTAEAEGASLAQRSVPMHLTHGLLSASVAVAFSLLVF